MKRSFLLEALKQSLVYALILTTFTSTLPLSTHHANASRFVELTEEDENDINKFPDHGNLTKQSSLWNASSAVENTTFRGTIGGQNVEIDLGKEEMIPLLAASKLTTELLLIFRRSHVEYGEDHFGKPAVQYNRGKTAHIQNMLRQAYPAEKFPDFQAYIDIQDDQSIDISREKLAEVHTPVGRGAMIGYLLDSLTIWGHDRLRLKLSAEKDEPKALMNQLRAQRDSWFAKGQNRILTGPFDLKHIPKVVNQTLFKQLLDMVMAYREAGQKSLKNPYLYEALVALVFYQYIHINQAAPQTKSRASFRSLMNLRSNPNRLQLTTLRTIIGETQIEDVRAGIFQAHNSYRYKKDFEHTLTVAADFHFQTWKVRMRQLNIALLFMARRQGADNWTKLWHMAPVPNIWLFGVELVEGQVDLEEHPITPEEANEPNDGLELLKHLMMVIPIFHNAPAMKGLLATAYGFKLETLNKVFAKLNVFYDHQTKQVEKNVKTMEWQLAAVGVLEIGATIVFQQPIVALGFLIWNTVVIGQMAMLNYFEALGSIPYLLHAMHRPPTERELTKITQEELSRMDNNIDRAMRGWYLAMGLIGAQAAAGAYLYVAKHGADPFKLFPVIGPAAKNSIKALPFVGKFFRSSNPQALMKAYFGGAKHVSAQRLRALADPDKFRKSIEHYKQFRPYDDSLRAGRINADYAFKELGEPYYNPKVALDPNPPSSQVGIKESYNSYTKFDDVINAHTDRVLKAQLRGDLTDDALESFRSAFLEELKASYPKSYQALRQKYNVQYSWLSKPVNVRPYTPWKELPVWSQKRLLFIKNSGVRVLQFFGRYVFSPFRNIKWFYSKTKQGLRKLFKVEEAENFADFVDQQVTWGKSADEMERAKGFTLQDFFEADGRYRRVNVVVTHKKRMTDDPAKGARAGDTRKVKIKVRNQDLKKVAQKRSKLIVNFLRRHPQFKSFYEFLEKRNMTEYLRVSAQAEDATLVARETFAEDIDVLLGKSRLTWGNMHPDQFEQWVGRLQEIGAINVNVSHLADELMQGIRVPHSMVVALLDYRHALMSVRNIDNLIARDPGISNFLSQRFKQLVDETNRVALASQSVTEGSLAREVKVFEHWLKRRYPHTYKKLSDNYYNGVGRLATKPNETRTEYLVRKIREGSDRPTNLPDGALTKEAFTSAEAAGLSDTAFFTDPTQFKTFAMNGDVQAFIQHRIDLLRTQRLLILYGNQLTPTRNPFYAWYQNTRLALNSFSPKTGAIVDQLDYRVRHWLDQEIVPRTAATPYADYRKMADASLFDLLSFGRTRRRANKLLAELQGGEGYVDSLVDRASSPQGKGINYLNVNNPSLGVEDLKETFGDLLELGSIQPARSEATATIAAVRRNTDLQNRLTQINSEITRLNQIKGLDMSPTKLMIIRHARKIGDKVKMPFGDRNLTLNQWLLRRQMSGHFTSVDIKKFHAIRVPLRHFERMLKGLHIATVGTANWVGKNFYKKIYGKESYWKVARWGLAGELTAGAYADLNALDLNLSEAFSGSEKSRQFLMNRIRNSGTILFIAPLALGNGSRMGGLMNYRFAGETASKFAALQLFWSGGLSTAQQMYEIGSWDPREVMEFQNLMGTNSYAVSSMAYGNVWQFPLNSYSMPLQQAAQGLPGPLGALTQYGIASAERGISNWLWGRVAYEDGYIDQWTHSIRENVNENLNRKKAKEQNRQDALLADAPPASPVTRDQLIQMQKSIEEAKKSGISHITMLAGGIPKDQDYTGTLLDGAEVIELEVVDPDNKMTMDDLIGYVGLTRKQITDNIKYVNTQSRDRFTLDQRDVRYGLTRLVNEPGATEEENLPDIGSDFDVKRELDYFLKPVHAFEQEMRKDPTKYLVPIEDEFLSQIEKKFKQVSRERIEDLGIAEDEYDYLGKKIPHGVMFTRNYNPGPVQAASGKELTIDDIEALPTVEKEYLEIKKLYWNHHRDWFMNNVKIVYKEYDEHPLEDDKLLLMQVVFYGYAGNVLFSIGERDGFRMDEDKGFYIETIEQKKNLSQFFIEDYFYRDIPDYQNFPPSLLQVNELWRDPNQKPKNQTPGQELSQEEALKMIQKQREEAKNSDGYFMSTIKGLTWWFGDLTGLYQMESRDDPKWTPRPHSWDPHTSLRAYMNDLLWRISEEPDHKVFSEVKRVRGNWKIFPIDLPTKEVKKVNIHQFLTYRWYMESFDLLDKDGNVIKNIGWDIERGVDIDAEKWYANKKLERERVKQGVDQAMEILDALRKKWDEAFGTKKEESEQAPKDESENKQDSKDQKTENGK